MTDAFTNLLRYPLFAALAPDWVRGCISAAPLVRVGTGETLVREGAVASDMFLIESGRVRLVRTGEREMSLGGCGPGELVGDHALLPPGRSRAGVRAAADSTVRRIPIGAVREAVASRPELAANLRAWVRLHFAVRVLRDEPSFGVMSGPSFLPLLDRCPALAIPRGTAIQADGLNADSYFLVRSGRAVWAPEGPGWVPRVLDPGDGFGAPALAEREVGATVVAAEDCTVVRVSRAAFLDRPADDPSDQTASVSPAGPVRQSFVWVGQERAEECGLASLAMIARYHGRALGVADLRPHVALGPHGASVSDLVAAAGRVGFRGNAVRVCPTVLAGASLPVVAHLRDGHFVVVFEYCSFTLTVGDPARGIVTVPVTEFLRMWSGAIILIHSLDHAPAGGRVPSATGHDRGTSRSDGGNAHRWAALREAAAALPPGEREVFELIVSGRLSQSQVAEQLAVDERTVRRRWRAACYALREALGGELPEDR